MFVRLCAAGFAKLVVHITFDWVVWQIEGEEQGNDEDKCVLKEREKTATGNCDLRALEPV